MFFIPRDGKGFSDYSLAMESVGPGSSTSRAQIHGFRSLSEAFFLRGSLYVAKRLGFIG